MLTLRLGCRVCAIRLAVLKGDFIRLMEICTVMLILKVYRI
jgi:hypothetical protein